MIPAERLLEKLNELPRHSGGRQAFVHTDAASGSGVTIEFDLLEGLAAQIWSVEVQTGRPPVLPLADRAKELARRVTGLLEALHVVEVDAGLGRALLRSAQPAAKAEERHYHELIVEAAGRATLRRYQGSIAVSGRRQISFTLTRDALAKLVADLSS